MKSTILKFTVLLTFVFITSCSKDEIDNPVTSTPTKKEEEQQPPVVSKYTWAKTADSLQVTLNTVYLGDKGTYLQDNIGNKRFHYWPNAHVLHVLIDAYNRTEEQKYLIRAKSLLLGIKDKNGGDYENLFVDDMLWLGNSSMRAYEASNDDEYLNIAKYLWEIIKENWSDDVFGGGITWKQNTPQLKNACSNGPAAILAMRLYESEGNDEYLDWAKKIYEWEKNTLVDPATGLVWDHITIEDGKQIIKKNWIFSYNVGTYLGSGLKLYQATGEQHYLTDALKTAKAIRPSAQLTKGGILKAEGSGGDSGLFKGILIRYFTQLILEPDVQNNDRQHFIAFLENNAKTFYDNAIDRPSMVVSQNWNEAPGDQVYLTSQLSGMMLMEAMALLENKNFLD